MSKTDRMNIRHNLSFDMQDDQQRIAHEYLSKLGRRQSKKIAELICSMLSQNEIANVGALSAEKAEKLNALFFNPDDEKQKEACEYLSILGERRFEKIAELVVELLSQNGIDDVSTLSANEAYALKIIPWTKALETAMDCAMQKVLARNPSGDECKDQEPFLHHICEAVKQPVDQEEPIGTATEGQLEKVIGVYEDEDLDDIDDDSDDDSGINMDLFKSFG